MPGVYGEIKVVTAAIASGQATSSGVFLGGYSKIGLFVPTLTSAGVGFLGETARAVGAPTGAAWALFRTTAGAQISAAPPGGITAMWLGSDNLAFLAGFHGEVRVSAAAAQGSGRDFVWHLKG